MTEEELRGTTPAQRAAVAAVYEQLGVTAAPPLSPEDGALHLGLDLGAPHSIEEAALQTNRELASFSRVARGTRVLDAGCGIGGSSLWLAEQLGAGVTGISILPEQIAIARSRAQRSPTIDVTFEVRDYLRTGFAPRSFDVLWHIESLCHCTDVSTYLGHAHELLDGGGRFACIDAFASDGGEPAWSQLRRALAFGEPRTPSALAEGLRRQGFIDVEVIDLRARVLAAAKTCRGLVLLGEALRGGGSTQRTPTDAALVAFTDALLSGDITYALVGGRKRPS